MTLDPDAQFAAAVAGMKNRQNADQFPGFQAEKSAQYRADVRMKCAQMAYSYAHINGLSPATIIEEAQKLADFVLGGAS